MTECFDTQRVLHEPLPMETPLQLAREMAEFQMLYQSSDDDEARDHWRGEYESTKRRYHVLVERLKKSPKQ